MIATNATITRITASNRNDSGSAHTCPRATPRVHRHVCIGGGEAAARHPAQRLPHPTTSHTLQHTRSPVVDRSRVHALPRRTPALARGLDARRRRRGRAMFRVPRIIMRHTRLDRSAAYGLAADPAVALLLHTHKHTHRDWAQTSQICTGLGLSAPKLTPGLGSPRATSAPGLRMRRQQDETGSRASSARRSPLPPRVCSATRRRGMLQDGIGRVSPLCTRSFARLRRR